jgi:hypothetical protein
MDIGPAKRIIEVEPVSIPVPDAPDAVPVSPEPTHEPAHEPSREPEPVPAGVTR